MLQNLLARIGLISIVFLLGDCAADLSKSFDYMLSDYLLAFGLTDVTATSAWNVIQPSNVLYIVAFCWVIGVVALYFRKANTLINISLGEFGLKFKPDLQTVFRRLRKSTIGSQLCMIAIGFTPFVTTVALPLEYAMKGWNSVCPWSWLKLYAPGHEPVSE